jgi:wobble nucleotide-excising tRNase
MLERIEQIQGVGLLHDANGKPYTCQKATLIYADNGRGKSTLATVLRSLSTGDASLIAQRRTVDGTMPPKAILHFGSGHKVTYSGNVWSETRPEVLVFDADFVERNVHSGGAINTGHRKNLLEFALGEVAVAARSDVDKATFDAKAAADKVHSLETQLSGYHSGLTLMQFEKLPKVPDADAQVSLLEKRISAATNVAAIAAKPVPTLVAEPLFDLVGLFADLGTSLANVHAEAEQIVKQHVQKLGFKTAETWLSQGGQFGNAETCPYCAQSTKDNDLIRAYQTHFNAAYSALKKKVTALHDTVNTGTSKITITAFSQSVATARAQAAAWNEHMQTVPIAFDEEVARPALAELQTFLLDLVRRKQASPAEPFGSASELEKATGLWKQMALCMKNTNAQIKLAAEQIAAYKGKLATDNVQQLRHQLQQLQASKRRHEPVVVALFANRVLARSEASTADNNKKNARVKLDTVMTKTLEQYERSINTLLKRFGASFSIKGMGANFRGAAPRSEYGLLLRGKDVALEGGPPSFATTLSEGDKRTLAFAFFIASTLADPKLATRVVVVDDPMCSLDLNRRHHTRSVLKNLHSKAEQLIVLAHDPYFIRDLRDVLRKQNNSTAIALFQLALAPGDYTSFAPLDVDKECESDYLQHHRLLNESLAGKNADPRAVAKAIRPMLEGYLHRRFPGLILKSLMFGQIVSLIRNAPQGSPLLHAKGLVDELDDINDYAGQFHHDTNPGADTIAVVASELKTYVQRSLHLVHSGAVLA